MAKFPYSASCAGVDDMRRSSCYQLNFGSGSVLNPISFEWRKASLAWWQSEEGRHIELYLLCGYVYCGRMIRNWHRSSPIFVDV